LGLDDDDSREPDHKNGDKLNTAERTFGSLAVARTPNNANHRKQRTSTSSRYKGVSKASDCARWQAYIHVGDKKIHLGLFRSEEEAALAYNVAAFAAWGDYARLNRVPE
jgi:hypothetical protein